MTLRNTLLGVLSGQGIAKRREIVDTAARLFDHSVSMDDIADAAGLSKVGLYHFKGKAQILHEVHRQFMFPLLEAERERACAGISAVHELRAIMHHVIDFFGSRSGYMRVFSEHLRDLDSAARAEVEADRDEYRRLTQSAIERGSANGEFHVADARIAALTLLGAVNWSYQWFRINGEMSSADVGDAIWRKRVLGFAPRPTTRSRGRHD